MTDGLCFPNKKHFKMSYRRLHNEKILQPKVDETELRQDVSRYLRVQPFLFDLRKKYRSRRITSEQYSRLRKVALQSGPEAAIRELENVLYEVAQ